MLAAVDSYYAFKIADIAAMLCFRATRCLFLCYYATDFAMLCYMLMICCARAHDAADDIDAIFR